MTMRNNSPNSERISPFQGPTPFTEKDKDWFFGRDRETDELLSLILGHKVVLMYAQSGAGKTSLINSRIIPELEEHQLYVLPVARVRFEETGWVSSEFSEGSDGKGKQTVDLQSSPVVTGNQSLYNPFIYSALQYLMTDFNLHRNSQNSNSRIVTLSDFLIENFLLNEDENEIVNKKGVAIIFDQLEELFRSSLEIRRETLHDFFNQIAKALEIENLSVRVIFVIREDYLAQLDPFAFILPEKLRPRFRLERLRKEEAKAALEKPLLKSKDFFKDSGINERIDKLFRKSYPSLSTEFESVTTQFETTSLSVTERLVNNLSTTQVELPEGGAREIPGEFVEPIYLQIVGQRLWDKLKVSGDEVSLNYLGDVGDVSKSLAEFYEGAIIDTAKVTGLSEGDIRIWCEKKLITTSGTRGSVHRGIEFTAGIPNKALDILEDKHVIRAEVRAGGGKWYELTHDRMLKPLIDSNSRWKMSLQEALGKRERKKRYTPLIVMAIPVVLFISFFAMSYLFSANFSGEFSYIDMKYSEHLTEFQKHDLSALAINPTTNTIYAAFNSNNTLVSAISGTTNSIIGKISFQVPIHFLELNPTTNMIYVSSDLPAKIVQIDGATNSIVGNIALGKDNITALAVNPTTNMIYAAIGLPAKIVQIDGATNSIVGNIPLSEGFVKALAVNPTTNMIYASLNEKGYSSTIIVINGATNSIVGNIEGRYNQIDSLSVNPTTNMIYAYSKSKYSDSGILVINGTTNSILGSIKSKIVSLTINPNTNTLYTCIERYETDCSIIESIGGRSNLINASFDVENPGYLISVNPSTNMIYTFASRDSITVINGNDNFEEFHMLK